MYKKFYLKTMLLLLALIVGGVNLYAQDAEPEVILDFSTNDWGFPTTKTVDENTYTNDDGYTITLKGMEGNGYRWYEASGNTPAYLINGKQGATLTLPAFDFDVEKIELVGKTGASGSVGQNIFVGETAVSTQVIGATGTSSFEISSNYQAAGNIYVIKVTTAHNTQYTAIKIYKKQGQTSTNPVINADNITLQYESISGSINCEVINPVSGGVLSATTDSDWLTVSNSLGNIVYSAEANYTESDRTATVTLTYTYNTNQTVTKSITVTQKHYVVDYAELPFEYDGTGATVLANTVNGLTGEGLESYNNSPKIQFNTTGDWLVLHINERPGKLTFDIKGNSFSGGTFKVQTSEDGTTYTDLATYTDLTATVQSKEFNNLGENVRYIKWIYTTKSSGNVALGNINLAKPSTDPFIEVAKTDVNVDYSFQDGTIGLTYANLDIASMEDFDIEFYDANQNVIPSGEEPDWIEVLVAEQDPQVGEGYVVSYVVNENEGEARTAYFKVFALGGEDYVYSNLVTISQAAPVIPTGNSYVKVTSTADITSGQYLIVYEGANVAFDGSLETLDAASNTIAVTINNNEIAATAATEAAEFTIDATDGTIKSASGYYIGQTSDANGMATNENTAYTNTISIDENGNADVISEGGAYLRYNATSGQTRFRYFKSSTYTNQKAIQLYKKSQAAASTATITLNAACHDADGMVYGTYSNTSAFVVPSNLIVSKIYIEDGKLNVSNYNEGDIVPANTGVMVSALEGGDYSVTLTDEEGTSVLGADNMLRATGAGITADQMAVEAPACKYYRLTMHNGTQIGFWWGADNGGAFAVDANKAYLAVPTEKASKMQGFTFGNDGDATEIVLNALKGEQNGEMYNLQGQKVGSEYKGIVIANGKKVMVK